jgi:hypothetical protein
MTLPINSNADFRTNVPFRGKVTETKRKLKIVSMMADSLLMREQEKKAYEAIAAAENPKTR